MKAPLIPLGIASIGLTPAVALAQPVHLETPAGSEQLASVGDPVWASRDFQSTGGVEISAPVYAKWSDDRVVRLPAGSELVTIRENDRKACAQRTTKQFYYFKFTGWNACLIDENDDGAFDKVTAKKLGSDKRLDPPVPYIIKPVPLQGKGAWAERRQLTYLGVDGSTLRLAYREFTNNYTAPDFTDEFTLPLPASYPATFVIKGRRLTVLEIDQTAMRYRVD